MRLSNLYISLNMNPLGVKLTENYIKFDSTFTKINRTNAYLFYLTKNFRKAIKKYTKCIQSGDTAVSVYRYLGMSYYKSESTDSAKKYLEKTFSKDTSDIQLQVKI